MERHAGSQRIRRLDAGKLAVLLLLVIVLIALLAAHQLLQAPGMP